MAHSGTDLTGKQSLFVLAYISPGATIDFAAKAAGIGRRTAFAWLKLPEVKAGIRAAQVDMYDQSMRRVLHLMDACIDTLKRNLSSEEVPASVQVQAAKILLDMSTNTTKLSEIESEMAELQRIVSSLDES